ncbi:4a-hydroxytetrahydrobiopterin dehydratase [Actinacidiphila acididurans]|uniref:Putative pterin-4-alpha-carbinolamine dehydratase n=1 Tax=Actinacidiphila acididurans TaxID=2784346 RepID=A0ABS2TX34_9ACTN|nr:4a-hydroxytetrahydrobiopterin dehydratase [Actinacidiphila acididurans]MBM9507903.1 4a-hydroxytetrahydrobiopterin dehydratase [Actinacidiphila acididurans]
MPYAEPLTPEQIDERLAALPGWAVSEDGRTLSRTYRLPHVRAAIFALHIAGIQDELNHHSDLTVGYDTLNVAVTTHAAGSRLTTKDFDLATRIAAVAPGHGVE